MESSLGGGDGRPVDMRHRLFHQQFADWESDRVYGGNVHRRVAVEIDGIQRGSY